MLRPASHAFRLVLRVTPVASASILSNASALTMSWGSTRFEVQKLAEKEAKEAEAASHKKETEADETHNKKTEADEDEPKSDDFSLERLLADVMDEGVQNDPELSDLIK